MKPLLIANAIYLPISDTNKYMGGSINGDIFINQIFTLEEIKERHKGSSFIITEHINLHDLCRKWGKRV